MSLTAGAVGLALALDATLAEPPERIHPVAWFGRAVGLVDRQWATPRLAGVVAALALPLLAAGAVGGLVWTTGRQSAIGAAVLAGAVLFATTSLRLLLGTARDVCAATERDLDAAREQLLALAGRDGSTLSAGQVRSAAVESTAENLADGLVAPLAAFALGAQVSVAVGAAAAVWVKAINTMDSMLGYREKPVGWGPARLDDAVMWLPARASAVLIAIVTANPRTLSAARQWANDVPSPNSGWPMGALAAALDTRLEKPDVYVLNPDASLPSLSTAQRGIRLVAVAGVLAYALAAVAVVVPEVMTL